VAGVVRYLTLSEVLEVHRQVMAQSGGSRGAHASVHLEEFTAWLRTHVVVKD
jgi:hypothetical protein